MYPTFVDNDFGPWLDQYVDEFSTHVKISLNILKSIPLRGEISLDASQKVFNMQARPSKPCLWRKTFSAEVSTTGRAPTG